jgi:CheY-like chemotaxis protein
VLLIDDDPPFVRLLQAYFNDDTVTLTLAYDVCAGITLFMAGGFDLVLIDLEMPVVDGYTATVAMRSWERANGLPETPIVALTANWDIAGSNRSFAAGCDEHVTKPIGQQHLEDILNRWPVGKRNSKGERGNPERQRDLTVR